MFDETMIGQSSQILSDICQILHDSCEDNYDNFFYEAFDCGNSVRSHFFYEIGREIKYPDEGVENTFLLMRLVQKLNSLMEKNSNSRWISMTMKYNNHGKSEVKFKYEESEIAKKQGD